jgi:hypothetical protein
MAVNLVSPGVNIREVDLTRGGIVEGFSVIGAIAGPFVMGPVLEPVLIETENQLLEVFGKPQVADDQYEYWMSASNYLSYGGALRVVRSGINSTTRLTNAHYNTGVGSTLIQIYSDEDYNNNHTSDTAWRYSSKNPGSWANGLKVCVIDSFGDQIISGITTNATETEVFTANSSTTGNISANASTITGISTTSISLGQVIQTQLSGVLASSTTVVGIGSSVIDISPTSINPISIQNISFSFGSVAISTSGASILVGYAVTQRLTQTAAVGSDIVTYSGYLRGLVTEVNSNDKIIVKVTDRVDQLGVSYPVSYSNPGDPSVDENAFSFDTSRNESIYVTAVGGYGNNEFSAGDLTISDWYDNQVLQLENNRIFWKSIAPKPGTSQYSLERNSKDDEIHIVVIDDTGSISGSSGAILERYLNLSKAIDGRISPSQSIYYKNYVNNNSKFIYIGTQETGVASNLTATGSVPTDYTVSSGFWDNPTQNSKFNVVGSKIYALTGGRDYSGVNFVGGYSASTSDIISAYNIFTNVAEYDINYLLNGPSGGSNIYEAQAKAQSLIGIVEARKDCIAVISPYKDDIINQANSTTQTNSILKFFGPLPSSSYAVFDSGYKYTLDRFNDRFVYIPCNSDVAGLMAKTSINSYPWFSPAGSSRGALNNVIKLAYTPTQIQRDQLYTNRINPIISSSGYGSILFGDKTALSYVSAFDRINVRMLFLTIEKSIEQAARAQLFEFNDAITRSNFINIVEPYLRDVRAKRGITEFLIVCDETNNTPDIIDANQFKADIFVKPTRSINFIGLTFVATRTGVSFSEVVGTV